MSSAQSTGHLKSMKKKKAKINKYKSQTDKPKCMYAGDKATKVERCSRTHRLKGLKKWLIRPDKYETK